MALRHQKAEVGPSLRYGWVVFPCASVITHLAKTSPATSLLPAMLNDHGLSLPCVKTSLIELAAANCWMNDYV